MILMDLNDVILRTMRGLGYRLVAQAPSAGKFSSAQFSQDGFMDIKITVHRDDLLLDIKPSGGFAGWRWYDALALLKNLEKQGFKIQWIAENNAAEVERFLSHSISLLTDLRDQLGFSYFDGVVYKPDKEQDGAGRGY